MSFIMRMKLIILIFFSVLYCDAKIVAQDGLPDDRFGKAVSLSNDWIAIGANRDDNANGSNSGSVYVYKYENLVNDTSNVMKSFCNKMNLKFDPTRLYN